MPAGPRRLRQVGPEHGRYGGFPSLDAERTHGRVRTLSPARRSAHARCELVTPRRDRGPARLKMKPLAWLAPVTTIAAGDEATERPVLCQVPWRRDRRRPSELREPAPGCRSARVRLFDVVSAPCSARARRSAQRAIASISIDSKRLARGRRQARESRRCSRSLDENGGGAPRGSGMLDHHAWLALSRGSRSLRAGSKHAIASW